MHASLPASRHYCGIDGLGQIRPTLVSDSRFTARHHVTFSIESRRRTKELFGATMLSDRQAGPPGCMSVTSSRAFYPALAARATATALNSSGSQLHFAS